MKKVYLFIVVVLLVGIQLVTQPTETSTKTLSTEKVPVSTIKQEVPPHTFVPRVSRSRPLINKPPAKIVHPVKKTPKPRRIHRRTTSLDRAFDRVAQCESGGNPRAVNPSGKYRGAFQFDLPTWHEDPVNMPGDPIDYSYVTQRNAAKRLYAERGRSPWPECGRYLP